MNQMSPVTVDANGRVYQWPRVPAIAICLDGCEPAYLDEAIKAGLMPALEKIKAKGTVRTAHSVIPSFTNPNNLSIATGRPPAVHGICGNYLYNPETGEEVMMNDPVFLRAPTVFQAFYDAGAKVAVVTAKDKLRALLGHGLKFDEDRAICFSSEKSQTTTKAANGIDDASAWLGRPVPEVYSAELSEFVFAAGVKLLREWRPDVMYLTTTDYVQHKYAPGVKEATSRTRSGTSATRRKRPRITFGTGDTGLTDPAPSPACNGVSPAPERRPSAPPCPASRYPTGTPACPAADRDRSASGRSLRCRYRQRPRPRRRRRPSRPPPGKACRNGCIRNTSSPRARA